MFYVGVEADEKKVKQNVQSIDYNPEHSCTYMSLFAKNNGSIAEKKRTSQCSKETYSVEKVEKKLGHFLG